MIYAIGNSHDVDREIFGEEENCKVLQEAFFQDSQQNNADFDKNIFDKVMNSYQTIISTGGEQKEEETINIDIMLHQR